MAAHDHIPDPGKEGIQRSDWVLWCLAGAVAIVLFLIQKTPLVTVSLLLLLDVLVIIPALHMPFVRMSRPGLSRILSQALVVLLSTVGVVALGTQVWPPPARLLHIVTAEEHKRFVDALKSQPIPREIVRLGCPSGKEDECLLVGQFIEFFKEAGWEVEHDEVARIAPGKPAAGLVLFAHANHVPEHLGPGEGVWVQQTPSMMSIEKAFAAIGIRSQQAGDGAMPKGTVGIYFGPDM
jgi:hypothetical protein